jgi:hypothetical protein
MHERGGCRNVKPLERRKGRASFHHQPDIRLGSRRLYLRGFERVPESGDKHD